jgi:hypothetical protein
MNKNGKPAKNGKHAAEPAFVILGELALRRAARKVRAENRCLGPPPSSFGKTAGLWPSPPENLAGQLPPSR